MKKLTVQVDGYTYEIELDLQPINDSGLVVQVHGIQYHVQAPNEHIRDGASEWFIIEGRPIEISVDEAFSWVETRWGTFPLKIEDRAKIVSPTRAGDGRVKAPIPGQVSAVIVSQGLHVIVGQPLLILEAMKMENEIRAPVSGRISMIHVESGQRVALNELLLEIE